MNTKSKWKSFSLLTGSILIMAVGIYFFKFANNFTFGGITGLAVLVAKTGVMSASDFTFLTNMLLLLLGFIVLGKKCGRLGALRKNHLRKRPIQTSALHPQLQKFLRP